LIDFGALTDSLQAERVRRYGGGARRIMIEHGIAGVGALDPAIGAPVAPRVGCSIHACGVWPPMPGPADERPADREPLKWTKIQNMRPFEHGAATSGRGARPPLGCSRNGGRLFWTLFRK